MSGFHKHLGMLMQISCIIPGIIWNSFRILAWIITIPSISPAHPHYSLISLHWREENPGTYLGFVGTFWYFGSLISQHAENSRAQDLSLWKAEDLGATFHQLFQRMECILLGNPSPLEYPAYQFY